MEHPQNELPARLRIPFSKKEDALLLNLVKMFGESNWQKIASMMNNRSVRQCRERWQNSLSPKILKKDWTVDEDKLLLEKYNKFGAHWKLIESFFVGRTSYSLRNRFHSLKKKLSEKFNDNEQNAQSDNIQPEIEPFIDDTLYTEFTSELLLNGIFNDQDNDNIEFDLFN